MRTIIASVMLMGLALGLNGCGDPPPYPAESESSGPPEVARPPEDVEVAKKDEEQDKQRGKKAEADKGPSQENGESGTKQDVSSSGSTERVQATVGVGSKGHYDSGGYIPTVISAKFRTEERLFFVQVQNNLKNFKAINGRNPKDHEEFVKEIVKPSALKEPELPPGQRFEYDPDRGPYGELMVLKPKPSAEKQ